MMHGRGKSDSAIVAVKPANKAVPTAAELVEPRAGAKGGGQGECGPAKHAPGSEPGNACQRRWSAYGPRPSVRSQQGPPRCGPPLGT
jgi:hypothetical protein